MAEVQANRENCGIDCQLHAECIKISGRSDVFNAKSVKLNEDELVLVSKTAVNPGTCIIVRMLNAPAARGRKAPDFFRTAGLAEVHRVKEVMDEDGLAYELGVKYLYTD